MADRQALTEPEAARVLDVHLSTLRRWRKKGAVGYTLTPGGRIRYSPEDLARLAAAMHVAPLLGRV